ncbi:MAG: PD-(D/E)XK nuclease family protein [Pseudomonadota bacterium]
MTETRTHLSTLIRSPDLEKISLMLAKPNIFEILRLAHHEIRHSNFLAWLLDPSQSHNLGDTFLKWFLKEVFQDERVSWIDEFDVDGVKTSNIIIHREYKHIDLLIEFPDWIVVIENKFGSSEHSNQLARYRKVAERNFPNKPKAFVYLTPQYEEPKSQDDRAVYVNFTYGSVIQLLEQACDIYSNTMPETVLHYITDYIRILKRYVMQDNDEAVELARKIYRNHKEALDFILEHKPDRLLEIGKVFSQRVEARGYVLGSKGKGFTRFLTKELDSVVPRESDGGWPNRESFLYEFDYRNKKVSFRATVAPGEQQLRQRIMDILSRVDGVKKPNSKSWSAVYSHSFNYELTSEKFFDEEKLVEVIDKVLDAVGPIIEKISVCLVDGLKNDSELADC